MQIQLAIDRVTLERAKEISREAGPYIDIIEVGTSLIKDYGIVSIKEIKSSFPDKIILADIKTMDEGAYEFKAAYSSGADIATVMGAASLDTIRACNEVARDFGKLIMIDILEVDDEKIHKLKDFKDAIFCVHLSIDSIGGNLISLIKEFKCKFPEIARIAVAGGVNHNTIVTLQESNVDIAIIGGSITKADSIENAAKAFREACK
jgi:3-hexulose-6-phosphate synthase